VTSTFGKHMYRHCIRRVYYLFFAGTNISPGVLIITTTAAATLRQPIGRHRELLRRPESRPHRRAVQHEGVCWVSFLRPPPPPPAPRSLAPAPSSPATGAPRGAAAVRTCCHSRSASLGDSFADQNTLSSAPSPRTSGHAFAEIVLRCADRTRSISCARSATPSCSCTSSVSQRSSSSSVMARPVARQRSATRRAA
jgi:hypothetical protein